MKLADAIPRDTIAVQFKTIRETVVIGDADTLRRSPAAVPICLFMWDELVGRKIVPNGDAMKAIYPAREHLIYKFVKERLGSEPVLDAYYAKLFNEHDANYPFIDVELCQCFPNDLHIADVEFSDNRKPITDHATYGMRPNHGLHIFGEFLERLRAIARERAVERISLVAASKAAHDVFTRHGFRVSETSPTASFAFDTWGHGHPMLLDV